ncbi:MAG: hypothetical protein ABI679_13930 [Gemmatimonadota bacterium]
MAELMLRPLSVGEIIDHSFAIYRRQFAALLLITLLANGIPAILGIYVTASGGGDAHPLLFLVSLIANVALGSLATAATVFLVSESYLGRSISAGDAFQRAVKYIWPLVLLSIGVGLLIGLGFLLLIVPGFIALCGLILATQALVLEDLTPSEARNRSWNLTKGFRWKMLGLLVVLGIIILIPSIGLGVLVETTSTAKITGQVDTQTIVWVAVQQLITIVIYPLLYCALTIAYYDLRVRKEGFDLELLESTLAHALPQGRVSQSRDLPNSHTFG